MMASRFPYYEPIGVWWTVDAPSLRVPDPAHDYVSIWSAGEDGPSILLVPRDGADHTAWEHLVPELAPYFTVHAMDTRTQLVTERDVVGVRTAADAVGARIVVADGNAAATALPAARADDMVLLCEPSQDVTALADARADPPNVVGKIQKIRLRAGAGGAEQLVTALQAVSSQLQRSADEQKAMTRKDAFDDRA